MRAAFALLADELTHNRVRKLAWQMFQRHGISLETCRLPPHVSLKQPFDIPNVDLLEDYMTELAGSFPPMDITLTELQLIELEESTAILWLQARPSPELVRLHTRLNEELTARFGSTQAEFDGPDYRFHMTLTIGQPYAAYQNAYQEFKAAFQEIQFQSRSIALFAYDSRAGGQWDYISYKILPIGEDR